ncbi:hypothetical protein JXO59_01000 [candidate division KSB1 bacterium]|nr:hypothetical protein [candidate division KSB1 bacterium]
MNRITSISLFIGLTSLVIGIVLLFCEPAQNLLRSSASLIKITALGPHFFSRLNVLAGEAIFRGILIILLGWLLLSRWQIIQKYFKNKKRAVWIAMALLAVICAPVILFGHSTIIAGERYWWLADDPMISMRYAHNLTQGHGLVWNPGERVEGYTTLLWTLFMALPHLLPIPLAKTSLFILLANGAITIAVLPLLRRLMQLLKVSDLTFGAVLISFVLSKNILAWSISGFETSLFMLLLVALVWRIIAESQKKQVTLITYLLIGLLPMVRSDGLLPAGLLYLFSFLLQSDRKKVVLFSAISLLLPIGHILFRLGYYGDWLPNTAYLKALNWPGRYTAGIGYTLGFLWHYGLLLLFAISGAIRSREKPIRLILIGCGIYALYIAYAGGDAFGNYRFLVPILPFLFILGFHGIDAVTRNPMKRYFLAILCFVTLPLSPMSYKDIVVPYPFDVGNIRIGLLIKKNTPKECKVADCWGGSAFYFSERYGVDVLGKMDRQVARRPAFPGANMPGHNRFDYDYSLGVHKPDLIVANFKLPVTEEEMRQHARGDWAFVGQLYLNPVFQRHYLPFPVNVPTLRTIFICDCSPLLAGRNSWQNLEDE